MVTLVTLLNSLSGRSAAWVDAMLPTDSRVEFLAKSTALKPRSFEKAVAPVDAENWISHMEKIFDVMDCNDVFKTRLAVYKFEVTRSSRVMRLVVEANKQAKGGDAWVLTLTWAAFKELFFLQFFPRAEQERLKREYAKKVQTCGISVEPDIQSALTDIVNGEFCVLDATKGTEVHGLMSPGECRRVWLLASIVAGWSSSAGTARRTLSEVRLPIIQAPLCHGTDEFKRLKDQLHGVVGARFYGTAEKLYAKFFTKCEFWLSKVAFLGHIVSAKGITMDPAKVEAITKWPRPTSVTELMRKGEKFVWDEEREKSFEELKQRLVSAPILTLPSGTGGFQIYMMLLRRALDVVLMLHGNDLLGLTTTKAI
ncbi:hypothetical protein Tco_0186168 [Tanacetum coccineum]